MTHCQHIQQLILEKGPESLRDHRVYQKHIASCEACFTFLEASSELGPMLLGLPVHQPPESLVQKTIAAIEKQTVSTQTPALPEPESKEDPPAAEHHAKGLKTRLFETNRTPFFLSAAAMFLIAFFVVVFQSKNAWLYAPPITTEMGQIELKPSAKKPLETVQDDETEDVDHPDQDPIGGHSEVIIVDENDEEKRADLSKAIDSLDVVGFQEAPKKLQEAHRRDMDRQKNRKQKEEDFSTESKEDRLRTSGLSGYIAKKNKNEQVQVESEEQQTLQGLDILPGQMQETLQVAPAEKEKKIANLPPSPTFVPSDIDAEPLNVQGAISNENSYLVDGKTPDDAASEEEPELQLTDEWEIGIPDAPPKDSMARVGQVGMEPPVFTKRVEPEIPAAVKEGQLTLEAILSSDGSIREINPIQKSDYLPAEFEKHAIEALKQWQFLPGSNLGKPTSYRLRLHFTIEAGHLILSEEIDFFSSLDEPNTFFDDFNDSIRDPFPANFVDPHGYWKNTYLPGDSSVRTLLARMENLRKHDPEFLGNIPRLSRPKQPFDAPEQSALMLHLNGSQRWVDKRTRMLLQVGISSTKSTTGHRPALHLGLVLDIPETYDADTVDTFMGVLDAFNQSKDITDRFTLVLAGRPGGVVLHPEEFRHGAFTILRQQLLNQRAWPDEQVLTLKKALKSAANEVVKSSRKSVQVGNHALILITARELPEFDDLEKWVHKKALKGFQLSAFAVGPNVSEDQMNQLILAGQGNKRFLNSAQEAKSAVTSELLAASRIVAKAVRLNIKLGPHTQLVDILGSEKLTNKSAQRVRAAEKSIDRQLSKQLGIQSDRGDDEDGIQIVIPNFYANDTHIILLDVVCAQPGIQMSVSMKYKDLVFLRNGRSTSNLDCSNREVPPTAMEFQVFKNRIAYEVSQGLSTIAMHLSYMSPGMEIGYLQADVQRLIHILRGYQRQHPFFANDPDLKKDLELLMYIYRFINNPNDSTREDVVRLSQEVKLSSFLKTRTVLEWE